MSLTFKSVKINFKLTEETLNFYATMYWNHVRVGTVKNYGKGGAHIYDWKQSPQATEAKDWLIHHPDTFRLKSCDVVDYDHVITHLVLNTTGIINSKSGVKPKQSFVVPIHQTTLGSDSTSNIRKK